MFYGLKPVCIKMLLTGFFVSSRRPKPQELGEFSDRNLESCESIESGRQDIILFYDA